MKLLSLFSGIGAFEKALNNIGIDVELIGFSEIDKYAIKSYCAIHNVSENLNLGDITKINISTLPKNIDMITHGSPCQDFSAAGKQAGGDLGTDTRSSLMWNTVNIVTVKPKYVIWENVKNILSKKHIHNFENYLKTLENLGYNNYYKILNSKDYGIPQNRERVYTISIRKDVDIGNFMFPQKESLNIRLKDILETDVEDKFYLKQKGVVLLTQQEERIPLNNYELGAYGRNFGSKGKLENEICNTLQAAMGNGGGNIPLVEEKTPLNNYKIRKLTPKECWRLMGFSDEDFNKAKLTGNSNSQLYKQAGNSIVVNVLERIFENLLKKGKKNE